MMDQKPQSGYQRLKLRHAALTENYAALKQEAAELAAQLEAALVLNARLTERLKQIGAA